MKYNTKDQNDKEKNRKKNATERPNIEEQGKSERKRKGIIKSRTR